MPIHKFTSTIESNDLLTASTSSTDSKIGQPGEKMNTVGENEAREDQIDSGNFEILAALSGREGIETNLARYKPGIPGLMSSKFSSQSPNENGAKRSETLFQASTRPIINTLESKTAYLIRSEAFYRDPESPLVHLKGQLASL
jgi:hypothetical protein